MHPIVFCLLTLLYLPLFGSFESYLKPIESQCYDPSLHSIRNIDFIYLINLDERPGKFAHCLNEFSPYKIIPYRFSAINGWKMPEDSFKDIGVRCDHESAGFLATSYFFGRDAPLHERMRPSEKTYFCLGLTPGGIGIILSHLSVLQDAWNKGYETIWVLEDDIEVIQNPHLLSDRIKKLDKLVGKKGWDILFTDKDTKDKKGEYVICLSHAPRPNFMPSNPKKFSKQKVIHKHFRRIGSRYGTYSMILRRRGIRKILDFFRQYQVFLPYDMDVFLPEGIRSYTVLDDIVSTQPQALSDNQTPGYEG